MRIPLSWLKDYLDLTLTPQEIAKTLTMAGLEVDGVETIGDQLEKIVVAEVLETEKHPNADKLCVAKVSDGKEVYQIVCGASNCRPGLKTALALIGAVFTDEQGQFTIKKNKLRGVESFGMLCSAKELGLSQEDAGIIELDPLLPVGTPIAEIFGETTFEISLTPNLNHCASVIGVARELAAATEKSVKLPPISIKESPESIESNLKVQIIDTQACPRYACRVIRNVKVGPSPKWLEERLAKSGLRSINNVVDVTNYVLLEMGHPLHAFDYDQIHTQTLVIRQAQAGETLQTLDGKERILKENMLVICDAQRPLAIAGVMGGQNSEVQQETRHIVLESAYFDPISIRKTSKSLGLQTEASKHFERGSDPNQVLISLDRAAQLIQEVAGGDITARIIDQKFKEFPQAVISCRLSRINQLIGIPISRGEVENIFKNLQFTVQWDNQETFKVKVPTYRVDLKSEIDLIEEVARLYGYDNIPRQGGYYQSSKLPPPPLYLFEKEIRERLVGAGLQELLTCDLIGPSALAIVQDSSVPAEAVVHVLNPTSIEQSILRTSLLPGLLQVVKYNVDHQNHQIRGFEVGRIHFREGKQYKEPLVLGLVLTSHAHSLHWDQKTSPYDFYDLKGIIESLLADLGIHNASFQNLNLPTFHSGRQASIFVDGLEIGSIGEIHPAIQRRLDVSQRILFGEFNLQDLMQVTKRLDKVTPLAIYPASTRDWTVTIQQSMPFATLLHVLKKQKCAVLENVSLKDIYRSEKLPAGYQNLTLNFIYRDNTRTIEQEVVDLEHQQLITAVINELGEAIKI
jgi:phenylalanyl-tRNA synthetase beta chain